MEINIKDNSTLEKELETLIRYIQNRNNSHMQKMQEYFITAIYLITNPVFREEITKLRSKYQIPEEWYTTDIYAEAYLKEWFISKKHIAPETPEHHEIAAICQKCHVNPKEWGYFVFDYFYYGIVIPDKISDYYHTEAKDEARYRCRIEAITKNYGIDNIAVSGERGYIRFYNDTGIDGLHKFIEENKEKIREIQKDLRPYPSPRTKKYKTLDKKTGIEYLTFKRDIQVYILHLLGYKISSRIINSKDEKIDLQQQLLNDNVLLEEYINNKSKRLQAIYMENAEKLYDISEKKTYSIIEDIDSRIKNLSEPSTVF